MSRQLQLWVRRSVAVTAVGALAACSADEGTVGAPRSFAPDAPSLAFNEGTETGTYLVQYSSTGAVSTAEASIAGVGATVSRSIPMARLLYVQGLSDEGAATLAATPGLTVVRDRLVQWVPNPSSYAMNLVAASDAPAAAGTDQSGAQFFNAYQWSLKVTRADQAWTPSNGGAGELVCVLDTGIDQGHLDNAGIINPAFVTNAILVPRFASDLSTDDYHFHGTFVAGQIRSKGIATASVAPDSDPCAIKVLSEDGNGTFGDIIYGIFLATKMGADVINMSLGGFIQKSNPANAPFLAFLQEIIDAAHNRGVLVVAASGNDGLPFDDIYRLFGFIVIPAMMDNVVSVGATGPVGQQNFDQLTNYSNFGQMGAVDMVAPGGNGGQPGGVTADFIISLCSRFAFGGACAAGNFYLFGNGTSFAAPMVSGAGAVVESNVGSMSTGQLTSCLLSTAKGIAPMNKYGKGRLDVRRASLCTGL